MPFDRPVMSKRLVLSVALAVLGCSAEADTGGPDLPAFSGWTWAEDSTETSVSPNEPGAAAPGSANPESANPDDGTEPNGAPSTPPSSNEGQNPNNVPIAPANPGGDTGNTQGSNPTGNTQPGSTPPANTPPTSGGMQAGNGQNPPATQPGATQPEPPAPPPPLNCSAPRPNLTGGTQSCTVNAGGRVDGQSWFMWYSGSNGCMTPYEGLGGAFRATWNNSGDFLARMGQQWDETQTFDQLGTIGADIAFTKTGTGGSYSFIGVYGWSNNPLVEYYIVENSFGNGPAVPYATTQRGTVNLDGGTYRIYTGTKTNQPSIHGNATFLQVFSVRQTPRECGHVSISDHFRQWATMGINLGRMYEARVLVEAGGGSGSINFTTSRVTVD